MLWILWFTQMIVVMAETPANVEDVLTDYFSERVYNKMVRGQLDLRQTTKVDMNFSLISIDSFDEVNDNMDLMGVVYLSWKDERLVWDPDKYNDTQSVQVYQDKVWLPNVVLANPSQGVKIPGFDKLPTRCHHDGTVFWKAGDVFEIKCSADVTSFPFDRQTCGLIFHVWGYSSEEVTLVNSMDSIIVDYYTRHGLWTLKSTRVEARQFKYIRHLEYILVIERNATFFLVSILIPSILLGILSLLVFLIPQESGERISYSITVLLSIGVFLDLVGDHLPANSVRMASICYFLMALLVVSSIACFCSIISLRLYHRKSSSPVPKFYKLLAESRCCAADQMRSTLMNDGNMKFSVYEADEPSSNNDKQINNQNNCSETVSPTWQHVSNTFDRLCLVLLTCLFLFSICMYTYNVVKGRKYNPSDQSLTF